MLQGYDELKPSQAPLSPEYNGSQYNDSQPPYVWFCCENWDWHISAHQTEYHTAREQDGVDKS